MPRPIIIDTDPGTDDAVAIWLALASPELDVLGITAVAGNVPLHHTEKNARKICELAKRTDIKVFAGCARPLVRSLVTAETFHGPTGLGDTDLPEPTTPLQAGHAVDWLVQTLLAAGDGEITICPIGPLTNVAAAMVKEPRICAKIGEIVLMGGGYFEGNVTPAAEFNIYCDPHAAHVVFFSGVKLTMMPLDVTHLDVTHQARTNASRIAAVRAIGSPVAAAAADMMAAHGRHAAADRDKDGGPLHDPCVFAYLLKPELFAGRLCNVQVETGSELTMGMTVVDWWGVTDLPKICTVMTRIDADGYFALIAERLARL